MKCILPFLMAVTQCVVLLAQSTSERVLFLGNSYTGVNNLPFMLSQVCTSAGDTLIYDSNTPGGYTLQGHSTNATSLSKIAQGNWDYVVLQEQSQLPSFPEFQVAVDVYPYAATLDSLIRAANTCTETVFYMTWGRKNGDASNCANWPPVCTYEGMDSLLRLRYMTMTLINESIVSPVGAVWNYLRATQPQLELYDADQSHPSVAGTYAAACTFYAVLFRKTPEDITFTSTLSAADAALIRNAVKEIVYDTLSAWQVGAYDPLAEFTFIDTAGYTVFFTDASSHVDTYDWDFGDGEKDSLPSPTHTYEGPGTYEVSLTVSNCERSHTVVKNIVIEAEIEDTTSIYSLREEENYVRLFPNPVSDYFMLEYTGIGTMTYYLTDLTGKKIISGILEPGKVDIDVSQIATGTYYIIYNSKGIQTATPVTILKP